MEPITAKRPDVARSPASGTAPGSISCAQFLIRKHFAHLDSDLMKLVRIASMFDQASRRYVNATAASLFGELQVDMELQALHLKYFRAWLASSLENQQKEIDTCGPPDTVARATLLQWLAEEGDCLIPPGAMEVERALFKHDLSIVLHLLRARAPDRQRHAAEATNGSYEPAPQPATCW